MSSALINLPVLADDKCPEHLQQLVERYYDDPEIYCANLCGETVARLLSKMEIEGWDLTKAKVIYILSEYKKFRPVPALIRGKDISPVVNREFSSVWYYHALIEYDGKILDLHTEKEVNKPEDYFQQTFPQVNHPDPIYHIEDRLSEIYMRIIPAGKYLLDYKNLNKNPVPLVTKYRDIDLLEYPILSIREYLNRNLGPQ